MATWLTLTLATDPNPTVPIDSSRLSERSIKDWSGSTRLQVMLSHQRFVVIAVCLLQCRVGIRSDNRGNHQRGQEKYALGVHFQVANLVIIHSCLSFRGLSNEFSGKKLNALQAGRQYFPLCSKKRCDPPLDLAGFRNRPRVCVMIFFISRHHAVATQ